MNNGVLYLKNVSGKSEEGNLRLDLVYATANRNDIGMGLSLRLDKMKIGRVMQLIPGIDTIMPMFRGIDGIVNARIVEVGLKENQELATPVNIYDIGWYTGSDLPGTGVSVMDAHGGNAGQGIFRTLPNIQTGAEIAVEMGDGRLYTYVVTDTATKALGDDANAYMNTAFTSPEPGTPSLTLITCTGDWWLQSQTYSHRFFVRALLKTEPTE